MAGRNWMPAMATNSLELGNDGGGAPQTVLSADNLTADRTHSFPDVSGELLVNGAIQTKAPGGEITPLFSIVGFLIDDGPTEIFTCPVGYAFVPMDIVCNVQIARVGATVQLVKGVALVSDVMDVATDNAVVRCTEFDMLVAQMVPGDTLSIQGANTPSIFYTVTGYFVAI